MKILQLIKVNLVIALKYFLNVTIKEKVLKLAIVFLKLSKKQIMKFFILIEISNIKFTQSTFLLDSV